MSNKLANENSPYLLQHKENPVDWYPWGEEAFRLARENDKPVFLSIGYSACHWCHVMAHESFEDPGISKIMNEYFINIKVDREERPEIDNIYMNATVAMTGQGGWPMSVFLTPNGEPFFAGTYFPPTRRHNLPSFVDILNSIAHAWETDRVKILESGEFVKKHIQTIYKSKSSSKNKIDPEFLDSAALEIAQAYDWTHGGWGKAPKFPQSMTIRFLLQRATMGDRMSLDIATHALETMAKGGMYDILGGGFSRYSVDNKWLVPHFEKMLYDNAQLARVYLHAYLITKNEFFKKVCEDTLEFIRRELRHPSGGFYSSLDADSEGVEGKYYIWSFSEIENIIIDIDDRELFFMAYGITPEGNFEGNIVLQRVVRNEELSTRFSLSVTEVVEKLEYIQNLLFKKREARVRPNTDDKILTSWNSWTLIVFAEAARYLQRDDYLQIAVDNADFILKNLKGGNKLFRSWRDGKSGGKAYLEDYAGMVIGLLALYQSDPTPRWFGEANKLFLYILENFRDETWGFFDTALDHEKLILRPKDIQDNAVPSGNGLMLEALFLMGGYAGRDKWDGIVKLMLVGFGDMGGGKGGFSQWLCAINLLFSKPCELAILGNLSYPDTTNLIDVVWSQFRPFIIYSASNFPVEHNSPPLLKDKSLVDNKSTAYVCQNFVCKNPVTTEIDLQKQLQDQTDNSNITGQ